MDFSGQLTKKIDMKVEIPTQTEIIMGGSGSGSGSGSGLTRQQSVTKNNCLCSPTTHAGSFRCRLHRSPSLQRTKSMETNAALRDSTSKANNTITTATTTTTTTAQ